MTLSKQAKEAAVYLANALNEKIIDRHLTLVDVTTIGSSSREIMPVDGVIVPDKFVCPSLADFMELNLEGLIHVSEGLTSRGHRNWQILLKQNLLDYLSTTHTSKDEIMRIFLSYRRLPSAAWTRIIARELKDHNIEVLFDTQQTDGAGPFPVRLERMIETCDVFVCLLADTTLDSEWVRHEIKHAYMLHKPMIPIFQESYKSPVESSDEAVLSLLQYDGIHLLDVKNIYVEDAISKLAIMVRNTGIRRKGLLNSQQQTPLRYQKMVKVEAIDEHGTQTGIYVEPGDSLEIKATGNIIFDEQGTEADPDGYFLPPQPRVIDAPVQWKYERARQTRDDCGYIGSLFGWIGEPTKEKSFFIGKDFKGVTTDRGMLFLCVNDVIGEYGDNSGFFDVRVEVYRERK